MRRCTGVMVGAVLSAMVGGTAVMSSPVQAAESAPVETSHTRATLVSTVDAVGEGQKTLRVGLRLQLKPGWHTYWQNPGDAGEAPHVHVTLGGVRTGEAEQVEWPVPERVSEGGLMAYAYQGDVLLPVRVSMQGQGTGDVTVTVRADWLVCADVCVPEKGEFALTVPAGSHASAPEATEAVLFRRADAAMPQPSPFTAEISSGGVLSLRGAGLSSDTVRQAWFLPQEGSVIAQNVPQALSVNAGQMTLQLKPDSYAHPPFWQKPLAGVVVLVDGAGSQSALQITAAPVSGGGQPVQSVPDMKQETAQGLWGNLLSAFLGGVILNLMPCVFPVLAMKLLSFAHMGGAGWRTRWRSAALYSAGIMGCFVILGAVMMALRYGGAAVGWGFQFQSSAFVVGVGWLLFIMALNLLGVFQITGGRLVGRAGQMAAGHGPASDLLAGLLAVIVATPCTAPFMGVAIAAALGGPVWAGLLVFLVMGLGLAAPYCVLALVPGLAQRLPRPGAWMERLKQLLAFPLLASCVWLLWVAVLQRGGDAVLLMAGGAVLLGFAGWLYGLAQQRAMLGEVSRMVMICRLLAVLCVLACLVGLGQAVRTGDGAAPSSGRVVRADPLVEPFSGERLAALRAAGRPVFVDMTASWCVTCMVNEHVALDVPSVREAFRQHGVVILRGDWTRRDERITAFLRTHGRDGVPFYLYYPPQGKEQILPQVLTAGCILGLFNRRSTGKEFYNYYDWLKYYLAVIN
ncbi:protein-disulfide reductase DsbD family protein [Bombella sp. TMW 2.2559]|uniref:Protein-disulfide reductase DsbD family protein n=1 Tax=Bombella dulcis TaxID=2967339 RepID=A0ABT3WFW6_9PROT|nr:protein-disulfide reductase DsbD domain-containing protein [Bombella dulcis]MCX5616528.1 protein-disulfide reductase DsbD family protein [Bombella dulcis]